MVKSIFVYALLLCNQLLVSLIKQSGVSESDVVVFEDMLIHAIFDKDDASIKDKFVEAAEKALLPIVE